MAQTIDLEPGLLAYDIDSILIDGVRITINFQWRTRCPGWYMGFFTPEGEAIILNVRAVVGVPLVFGDDPRLPPGVFVVTRLDGLDRDPGLTEFGDVAVLQYIPVEEIAEITVDENAPRFEVRS